MSTNTYIMSTTLIYTFEHTVLKSLDKPILAKAQNILSWEKKAIRKNVHKYTILGNII